MAAKSEKVFEGGGPMVVRELLPAEMMTKSERLRGMLEFIKEYPGLTSKDLAQLCDVSQRTICRYISNLSEAGISVHLEDGGYKLRGDYTEILKKLDSCSETSSEGD